jgi:hypothetical protein
VFIFKISVMKRFLTIFIGFFLIISIPSCEKIAGDGISVSDVRVLVPFNGIRLILDCDVSFILSDTVTRFDPINQTWYKKDSSLYKVIIRTESNIKNLIETPVVNGRLVIRLQEDKILRSYDRIKVEIRAPDISYVEMTGPGSLNISLRDNITRPFLDCTVTSQGSLNLRHIKYSYLKINIPGPGYAFCDSTGRVNTIELATAANGDINLFNILADTVYASVKGTGEISVSVDSLLNGTISGSGNIWYKGVKPEVKSNITGTGRIIHL